MQRQNLHVHYSAEDYDRYSKNAIGEYDDGLLKRVRQEWMTMSARNPRLVDIGTGTAQLLIRMAGDPRYDRFELIGTDYFEDMLDTARAAVAEAGCSDRVRLELNDVHDLPYDDQSVDFVTSRSTIHHWQNPVQAFREIFRILKPGGVALIHEPRRDPNPEALAEFNRRRHELGIEDARMDEKYTPTEVSRFLVEADVARFGVINAPSRGPHSMGFEVRIARRHPLRISGFRVASRVRTAFLWF